MSQDAAPVGDFDFSDVPDAKPVWEPLSPGGNKSPYRVRGKTYHILPSSEGYAQDGIASWYGLKFHGELTSNGEVYNMYEMSAAHKTLPLPSYLSVTNLDNGKRVVVRVNDRGPFHSERIIDLSFAAANRLGFANKGTARVRLEAITVASPASSPVTGQADSLNKASKVEVTGSPVIKNAGIVPVIEDRLAPFVQVAAYSSAVSAGSLVERLRQRFGYDNAFVAQSEVAGRQVYRVRLGPFPSNGDALAVQQRIKTANIGEPIIITRSVLASDR